MPSGAASRSRKLKVGDRLVSCNGIKLRGVNQSKCLSILKSEANNGDFEIGILRPVENDIPTEFSLTLSNGNHHETEVILKSPQLNKRMSDNPFNSESDPEVVLNSFQNFDNLFASNTVKLSYQKPVHQTRQKTEYTSDSSSEFDSSSEKDITTKSNKKSKMGSEEWSFALPPPAEFSDGPENEQEESVPMTSIDDVLNEYSPTCSNMSTPIHQPTPPENMKIIEDLVGLEDDKNVSSEFPLTQIDESPLEQINNSFVDELIEDGEEDNLENQSSNEVVDNYFSLQQEDDETNFVNTNGDLSPEQLPEVDDSEKQPEKKSKNYFNLVGNIHQFYYNTSDSLSQSENDDNDIIQPVIVQKELCIPDFLKEHGETDTSFVEEETIAPASVERNIKLPVSAKFDVNTFVEIKKEEKPSNFPLPVKSKSPPLPESRKDKPKKSRPETKLDYNKEEIVETFIPIQAKKEEYSKIIDEKLGRGIEEDAIVPTEVKRDNSFHDSVQLIMATNRWASAAKEKKSGDITFSGMVKQIKKTEPNIDQAATVDNEDDAKEHVIKGEELSEREEEQIQERHFPNRKSLDDIGNEIAKTVVKNSLDEICSSVGKQVNNKSEIDKDNETVCNKSDKPQHKDELQQNSETISEDTDKPALNVHKEDDPVKSIHKTTVAVTTSSSQSILGTVQGQNSTSSSIKPQSTVKPLSFNALSLNRPTKYTTTINTGSKPSLLSTIYSKTQPVSSSVRSEEESFLVSVMKGILGIGMKVEVQPEGYVQVTEIQPNGPVGKDGNIRVGDYILSINSTELTGLPDHKVQQIIRLLPRGLAKLVVSVTPPDITKIDNSISKSRPPDLAINTSYTAPRRLTPALSPKTGTVTSPKGSFTSPPSMNKPSPVKPLSPALSPSSHQSPVTSPPVVPSKSLSPSLSPTNQPPVEGFSPVSPKSLTTALSPRKTGSQQTDKPVAMPRHAVPHDAKEFSLENGQIKPPTSPRKPVEDIMSSTIEAVTKKEPPPIAPKPKPRTLPQQTETASHHKITPSIGGYVSSAVGQLKQSHGTSIVDKEPIITAKHTDYVSSARKASHDAADKDTIDTVIFASISSNPKTDYVSSARKNFEEPKLIPSGIVDYVPKERPKAAERTKPATFQVLPMTGSTEGGVKIAPVRLNSALSPRKTKGSDKSSGSFNFNAKFSYDDKALPRAGYFVGKTDVVTSPKETSTSLEEDVSIPEFPTPRLEDDSSVSPDIGESQIDVVACTQGNVPTSPHNFVSSRSESNISPVFTQYTESIPSPSGDIGFSNSLENNPEMLNNDKDSVTESEHTDKHINNNDAFGVVHEAEIISNFSYNQENLPKIDFKVLQHGESNDYMHDVKSKQESTFSYDTNTLDIDNNMNTRDSDINTSMESDCTQEMDDTGTKSFISVPANIEPITCMNFEPQSACSNVVNETEDICDERSFDLVHGNVHDLNDNHGNDNLGVELNPDSDPISLEQEHLELEDQQTSLSVETSDLNVDRTYLDINQDLKNDLFVNSVPSGFGDDMDTLGVSDIHYSDKVDSKDNSPYLDTCASSGPTITISPSYCVKFPSVDNSDSVFVSSQRPFSIICGKQTFSVNIKSNNVDNSLVCDLLISTQMLANDLDLANHTMDSLGRSNQDTISVILLEQEDNRLPVGLNLCCGPEGNMVVSQLDSSGLFQQSGHVKEGDTILLINGEIVNSENADAILQSLENSESRLVCVVTSPGLSFRSKGDNKTIFQTSVDNLPDSPTGDENGNNKI